MISNFTYLLKIMELGERKKAKTKIAIEHETCQQGLFIGHLNSEVAMGNQKVQKILGSSLIV
jgi:hypothetical protein